MGCVHFDPASPGLKRGYCMHPKMFKDSELDKPDDDVASYREEPYGGTLIFVGYLFGCVHHEIP